MLVSPLRRVAVHQYASLTNLICSGVLNVFIKVVLLHSLQGFRHAFQLIQTMLFQFKRKGGTFISTFFRV